MAVRPIRHETERLVLRELEVSDAGFVLRLLNDPGWLRFIGDRGVRTVEGAAAYLREGPRRCYEEHGFGLLLVEARGGGDAVGICGLLKRATLDAPDLGFAFLETASGLGYATEAGRVVLAHADEVLGLPRVLAITSPDNTASMRVLEKLGFAAEGARVLEPGAAPVHVFSRRLAGAQ